LLKWTEQLHASLVKLRISHELAIVGGVGHDFHGLMLVEHQRFAADRFSGSQP